MKNILVTAALPYINNVPHMGHIVGSHLPADIFHRYCLQKGYNSTFVGGSDEYGTPSIIAAREIGIDIKEFVDKLHDIHKKIYKKLNISYDNYSRTTSEVHSKMVNDFFEKVSENGYISKEKIKMYYSEKDNMFLPDRFILGTCPTCLNENANGDQCELCGYVLNSAQELINPRAKMSGSIPVLKETEHIYLNLDDLSKGVEDWLESKKSLLKNNVYSEGKKWIKEGLKRRSISRDMDWGVKIPQEILKDKVFYVWFDAPIGYISFAKEISKDNLWQSDSEVYHFLGKDNIPFHIIFWPSMLKANKNFNMPYYVSGYNFLNYNGQKFSKSKNIGVFCYNILKSDINIDSLRFYLTSVIPENKDSEFVWDNFKNCINSELIGNLSNFFNRTLSMAWSNFKVDTLCKVEYRDTFLKDDQIILSSLKEYPEIIDNLFSNLEIRQAQKKILELSSIGNKYIDSQEPWKFKNDKNKLSKILILCLNICKTVAILTSPIIPDKMTEFWNNQLGLLGSPLDKENYNFHLIKVFNINIPYTLFNKIDKEYLEKLEKEFSIPFNFKDIK